MTRVDHLYIEKAKEILQYGYREDQVQNNRVRAVWDQGEQAYAIYLSQQGITYYPGEVPLTTLRRIAWKSAIREILWIYGDKSNDVACLKEKHNVHYWDAWANKEGTLGTAYGYQIAKPITSPETGQITDQMDRVLSLLKDNPLNRRIMTTMIDMDEMAQMTLVPCAFMTLWTVTQNQLNLTLIQRSGDFLAAASPGGINAFQYYALMRMVAQVTGYEPGQVFHFVQNLHIYDRHVDTIEQIITVTPPQEKGPRLNLNPEITNFYDFTIDDFELVEYHPDPTKYTIPIAL